MLDKIRTAFLCLAMIIAAPLGAQESGLVTLQTRQDSTGWDAVGRLDIRDKGFCTAALIREQLILTAAHCLFDADGTVISPDRFTFYAGLRDGRAEATRRIRRAVAHPDYRMDQNATDAASVSVDIAVLELDRPVRTSRIQPYQTTANPHTGDRVRVVSYARGREAAASLQELCVVLGRQTGVIVMTCDVDFGSSGAPVFMELDGEYHIVSVVTAMAEISGTRVSLGTSLQMQLNKLLAHYITQRSQRQLGGQSLTTAGERNDTGAKFVTAPRD